MVFIFKLTKTQNELLKCAKMSELVSLSNYLSKYCLFIFDSVLKMIEFSSSLEEQENKVCCQSALTSDPSTWSISQTKCS
jgi:hypothetical protein